MKVTDEPVVVEQSYPATIETVWRAITEIDLMRRWYFENIPSFSPEVGFSTEFNIKSGGRDFLHLWKVTEAVPMTKLTYTWKFGGYPGDASVTFDLVEHENSTTLRLTFNVREEFPDDIPEFTRESCVGGWEFFIKRSLREFLKQA